MNITKTNYLDYLKCPEFAWLEKHKPNAVDTTPSGYGQKLIRDGYEVEAYAQGLFPDGEISETFFTKDNHPSQNCLFQPTFITEDDIEARLDILQMNADGTYDIFEVKSSTSIKQNNDQDYIRDVSFQRIVLEKCGIDVAAVHIIYLNDDYIREAELDIEKLFITEDVTDEVNNILGNVRVEIGEAQAWFQKDTIDESQCACCFQTRSNHCDAFTYFNGEKEKTSVYNIPRIGKNKLRLLLDDNSMDMTDVPDGFEISDKQQLHVQAAKSGKPLIDREGIQRLLSVYEYPLYFLDYETYQTAVPRIEGMSPHTHIPFQVSIHVLKESGEIEHAEYLGEELSQPRGLAEFLVDTVGEKGSIVVWNESFEKGRNTEMGELFAEHADFFRDMNDRIVDLQDVFKTAYIHPDACGSSSLKKVLPALLPEVTYDRLAIQDGTMAMERWEDLVTNNLPEDEVAQRRKDLLAYCELDTLAMVKIYQHLQNEVLI